MLPTLNLSEWTTLLEPPKSGEGYWVGAPCVEVYEGSILLTVRHRSPAERGHTITIYRQSSDTNYTPVTTVTAEALDVESIERAALLTDPRTEQLKLYLPVDRGENDWAIRKLDDVDSPGDFEPSTARDVLVPGTAGSDTVTVKDPCIVTIGGRYYLYYAGHDGSSEQAHLATSRDGERWHRADGNPVFTRSGWHDHHTRITCVVPAADGPFWHVFFDGSGTDDFGSTWNLRTGHAISFDLTNIRDTTRDSPWLSTGADPTAGFATFRYLEVVDHNGMWELLAEVARSDGAFELRRATVDPF